MAKNNKKTKVAIIIFLITAIIATALTAVLAFGEKNEGYRTITVIEIGGTVGVVHGNMEYAAYTGMHLEEGYTVVTNGNSYVRLLLDDDKYVKLESGTKAIFSEVSGGKTAIDIERGALVAEVTKPLQVDEDFIVNTPNAVLAVRGTLFRVDLSRNDKGELNTDVMTYGGAVSSKRVQPSGEVEDIEVTIKEGFKATVNMDDKETVYLVDEVKVDLSALVGKPSGDNKPGDTTTETDVNGDIIENTPITLESVLMPIVVEDIPDDDLVDIYFASENGHSMFIETKEIEEKIVERNIDVTQKTSVYEVAQRVVEPVEVVIPDDNKPILTTTEVETEQAVAVQGTPNDGLGETTTEVTTETITELVTTTEPTTVTTTKAPTTTVPSTTAPTTTVPLTTVPTTTVPSTTAPTTTVPSTTAPTTTVPTTESTTVTTTQPTTEETTVHIHTETIEETKATCTETGIKTVKCSTCGEIISKTVLAATGHSETTNTVNATCTTDGKKTVSCSVCNETLSETVLSATGHSEIFSGAKDAHTECSVCYEVLSTSHSYTKSTTNPSCTLDGGTTYVCECGYNYTDMIPATGHTEKTTTVDATCKVDGKITVSCSVCTETLSETTIPATGHTEVYADKQSDVHTKCSVCGNTVKDGTYHDYTDEVTTPNSCTSDGVLTRTCACSWSYTTEIPASHTKADSTLSVTECSACGGVWVDLNSDNFPDSMFLSYVSSKFNTDTKVGDVALIGEELTGVTTINVAGNNTTDGGYTNLKGVDKFTNLTTLNCAYNSGITSLDLSGLTELESLDVTGLTNLKTLNISGCTSLTTITGLDTCTELTELNVSNTRVATLNLDVNKNVETVNLSNCSALTSFVINEGSASSGYALSSIDLTACTSLETLTINNCFNLTTVDFSDLTAIKTIDLGGCQGVTGTLDVSGKTALTSLVIGATKFTSLNVTGCTALATIDTAGCSNLNSINITSCTALTSLNARTSTSLTNIVGTSSCTNLASLVLVGTGVTSLDLEANTNLETLNVMNCTSLTNLNLTRTTPSTTFDSLTVTGCAALTNLNLYNCLGITSLVTTPLTALKELNLSYSGVKTFNGSTDTMNFSSNTALTYIYLNDIDGVFSTINVSSNTSLEEFYLTDNVNVQSLDLSANSALKKLVLARTSALTTLNVTSWSNLQTLSLNDVGLTSLSITGASSLVSADILNNGSLTGISISGASALRSIRLSDGTTNYKVTSLSITNSGITSLDVTYLPNITSLDVSGCASLTSIEGLDSLTNLTTFNASGSGVQELDFSYNELLTTINLSDSGITNFTMNGDGKTLAVNSILVEDCGELSEFTLINAPSVTNVDFATADNLTSIYIGNCTGFTGSYDVSNKTTLTSLNLYGCTNINSINVNGCNSLNSLTVGSTAITSLDVSDMTLLSNLSVTSCTELTSINISGCTSLTDLQTLHTCTKLEELNVSGSGINTLGVEVDVLETLDASNCENLQALMTNSTALTTLNISGSTNLLELIIQNSNITDFTAIGLADLQKLETFEASSANIDDTDLGTVLPLLSKGLKTLNLSGNTSITTIDVSEFIELTDLDISGCNGITDIDVTSCTSLVNLNVSGTSITILDTTSNQILESINMSGCTQLQAFQMKSGEEYAQLTTINATGCEKLEGVELTNCTALESLEFSNITTLSSLYIYGCTNLTTLNLKGSDNVTVLDVTDVGREKSSFMVTSTTGTTTATTVPNSTGWNSSYMVSKEE